MYLVVHMQPQVFRGKGLSSPLGLLPKRLPGLHPGHPQRCEWWPREEAGDGISLLHFLLLLLAALDLEGLGGPGEVTGLGKCHRLLHMLATCCPRHVEVKINEGCVGGEGR